jgi:hypothetical protein
MHRVGPLIAVPDAQFVRTHRKAALKCLYLVTRSLDPNGHGKARAVGSAVVRPQLVFASSIFAALAGVICWTLLRTVVPSIIVVSDLACSCVVFVSIVASGSRPGSYEWLIRRYSDVRPGRWLRRVAWRTAAGWRCRVCAATTPSAL